MFKIPNILDNLMSGSHKKIKGTVVLMKNNVLDFNDFHASVLDRVHELVGKGVSLQLINVGDSSTGTAGKLGKEAYLENWIGTLGPVTAGDTRFKVTFDVEGENGVPGAFVIRNNHNSKFFLKTVKLDVPGAGDILFVCNSWVYPASKYKKDRIFFANKTYLPIDTPLALRKYRQQELEQLRGDGTGQRKKWDRVYDYAYYNDLCDPDKDSVDYKRPTLGGSSKYPYPRRGRTGRPPTKSDPNRESRVLPLPPSKMYVPRDERFGPLKFSEIIAGVVKSVGQINPLERFGADAVKFVVQIVKPLVSMFEKTPKEFDSFQDVLDLYEGGLPLPEGIMKNIGDKIPLPMIKEIFRTDGARFLRLPVPQVIKGICQN